MKKVFVCSLLFSCLLCLTAGQAFSQDAERAPSAFWSWFKKCDPKIIYVPQLVYVHDTVIVLDTIYQDVVIHDTVPTDTSLILSMYCDTVPVDTIVDPIDTDTLFRALYLNGFYNIVGNKAYEDALIFDLKRWKFNCTYAYSLSDVLRDKSPALAKLHKRLRAEVPIKEIGAARGNSSSCTGAATTFNKAYPDSSDFDTWNLEYEAYNAADIATAWATNKVYLTEMKAGKEAGQVENSVQYFGWWTKAPMTVETPKTLVALTDYFIIHDYTSTPSFSYTKARCTDLNRECKAVGKTGIFRPLFSAEPDFMQGYYKTHSLDDAYFAWKEGFDAMNYTNLITDGYVVFALDFLRVAQPSSIPLARRAMGDISDILPDFVAPDFDNKTTERSKVLAEED